MIVKSDNYFNQIKEISDNKKVLLSKSPFTNTIVYLESDKVLGFLIYDVIYEKVEIIYIFTHKNCRRKHIAYNLLSYLINEVKEKDNITLEVNIKNNSAISLYRKFGFKEVAKRKGYYNGIDGILMEKKL